MSVDAITQLLAMRGLLLYKAIYISYTVALIVVAYVGRKVTFHRLKEKHVHLLCIFLI